jgi:hypothetical protein
MTWNVLSNDMKRPGPMTENTRFMERSTVNYHFNPESHEAHLRDTSMQTSFHRDI